MGKQIQIYLAQEDAADFESALKASGAIILKRSSTESRPLVSDTARAQSADGVGVDGYIVRSNDLEHVSMRAVPAQGYWTVDGLHSPVVEFFGCHFNGKTLRRGRLFYDEGYYDAAGMWVDKPKEFNSWARSVFGLAKKRFKKDPKLDAHVGPKAKEWQTKFNGAFESISFALPKNPAASG